MNAREGVAQGRDLGELLRGQFLLILYDRIQFDLSQVHRVRVAPLLIVIVIIAALEGVEGEFLA